MLGSATTACAPKEPAKSSPEAMKDAHDPDKLFERGKQFAKVGDLSRAQQYLVSAMDNGADAKRVLPVLLRVCVAAGSFREAVQYGERALTAHPNDTRLRFVVASLYESTGDSETARRYMQQVVHELPNDADAHFALAVLLRDDANDLQGADAELRAYLALAPNGPHAEEARASLLTHVPSSAGATSLTSADAGTAPSGPRELQSADADASAFPAPAAGSGDAGAPSTYDAHLPREIK